MALEDLTLNDLDDVQLTPESYDIAWFAADHHGHVALFYTAGQGPLPLAHFRNSAYALDPVNQWVMDLPVLGQPIPLIQTAPDAECVQHAAKGLFSYDWTDVHRSHGRVHQYELLAVPRQPLMLSQLPEEMAQAIQTVRFMNINFANSLLLDVGSLIPCREMQAY